MAAADMGGALGLADAHDMLVARRFVLLAGIEENRVAAAFHHPAEVADLVGEGASRECFCNVSMRKC